MECAEKWKRKSEIFYDFCDIKKAERDKKKAHQLLVLERYFIFHIHYYMMYEIKTID